jgi:hypothetical protein
MSWDCSSTASKRVRNFRNPGHEDSCGILDWPSTLRACQFRQHHLRRPRGKLDQQLREHPSLANWRLDPVNAIHSRNSEVLEYRIGNEPTAPSILVKHIVRSRSPAVAKEIVIREFAALESVRRKFDGPFLDTVPEPIALLAEVRAMVGHLPYSAAPSLLTVAKVEGVRNSNHDRVLAQREMEKRRSPLV